MITWTEEGDEPAGWMVDAGRAVRRERAQLAWVLIDTMANTGNGTMRMWHGLDAIRVMVADIEALAVLLTEPPMAVGL